MIFRTAKAAVMAMDASIKTGVGFMAAFQSLRTIGLIEAAVQGIVRRIFQRVGVACEVADAATLKVASYSVTAASSDDEIVKKCQEILKDLVKDGDHIVLGINAGKNNPGSDNLAGVVGGQTFNGKPYDIELPASMGMGERAIWTVGVEREVSNPNVKITVSLDGVEGAKDFNPALQLLLARRRRSRAATGSSSSPPAGEPRGRWSSSVRQSGAGIVSGVPSSGECTTPIRSRTTSSSRIASRTPTERWCPTSEKEGVVMTDFVREGRLFRVSGFNPSHRQLFLTSEALREDRTTKGSRSISGMWN